MFRNPKFLKFSALGLVVVVVFPLARAKAWGRRGHSTVAAVAATIVAKEEKKNWIKAHTVDLSYYANVPDLVWKKKETFAREEPEHFIDMDLLRSQMGIEQYKKPWPSDRKAFEDLYPKVPESTGRLPWRISEISSKLASVADRLKENKSNDQSRQDLEGEWLVLAGILAHYVGDLSQPLHVTENYDGQKTKQKGIHLYFEDTLVNELYPRLDDYVYEETKRLWPKLKRTLASLTLNQLIRQLAEDSFRLVPQVLATDKNVGRNNLSQSVRANKNMIVRRLAMGSVYLAEIWRRQLQWKPSTESLYYFEPTPKFLEPGPVTEDLVN